ncbi:MAG: DUF481 domain-containing protein [Gemmatimonadota bacterium]
MPRHASSRGGRRNPGGAVFRWLLLLLIPGVLQAQKTDVITLDNGDMVTGEMKSLERGTLVFKTASMGTPNVEWAEVVTANTDKRFVIALANGTLLFGSLKPGAADSVIVVTDTASVTTATQNVVSFERLKPDFWSALDGKIRAGIGFTQQNANTSFTLGADVQYVRRSYITKLDFNYRYSRQDDTDDIYNLSANLAHGRQFTGRWFYIGFLDASRNSQLSLDFRGTAGGGLGRFLIQSNRSDLGVWVAPAYAYEKYAGESGSGNFPLVLAADYRLAFKGTHDTDISSRLAVLPIIGGGGRWRVSFTLNFDREIVNNLDLGIGITELYDSRPPSVDAEKNDFSLTTYVGWSF